MAREPWTCPQCGVILAPHVDEHRCDGGSAVPAKPAPITPPGSGTLTVTSPPFAPNTTVVYPQTWWTATNVPSATFTRDIA